MKALLILASLALSVSACASGPPSHGKDKRGKGPRQGVTTLESGMATARPFAVLFTGFDTDADRRITAEELEVGINREWAFTDPNNAGAISTLTFKQWKLASLGHEDVMPGYRQFDQNGDQSISTDEFGDALRLNFARADKDQNQVLTRDELVRVVGFARPSEGERRGQGEGRGQGRGGRGGPPRQ